MQVSSNGRTQQSKCSFGVCGLTEFNV